MSACTIIKKKKLLANFCIYTLIHFKIWQSHSVLFGSTQSFTINIYIYIYSYSQTVFTKHWHSSPCSPFFPRFYLEELLISVSYCQHFVVKPLFLYFPHFLTLSYCHAFINHGADREEPMPALAVLFHWYYSTHSTEPFKPFCYFKSIICDSGKTHLLEPCACVFIFHQLPFRML